MKATGEHKLIVALEEVQKAWKEIFFIVKPHKDTDMVVLTEIDDVYTFLDENLAQVNMILGNRYAGIVRTQAESVKAELQKLDVALEEWMNLQKSWMYLENIFKSPDVKKALPAESTMFDAVHKFFVGFMTKVQKMAKARSVINSSNKLIDDFKQ